ncbi:sugar ABC transporter permease [Cohnella sp. CIP 111063]|jgi:putative aldouronate transport system permease protein|uniref:carbohydrate ABC transporter permease n=1 Tax=unclassified Cohnella TaxID=2636738 RepID=UPI000B8C6CB5|nr:MULTISPECIES: carbohydrate ABC transporter permease [unclassified Cohnella]OXS54482.1 sugar ABC transporter permease [Cohnella sp. CIP 111063]PRX63984.1 putative aldouronate transport system permease protein [Cohnella sp. SGD-V74]
MKLTSRTRTAGDILFDIGNVVFMIGLMVVTLYPFANMLAVSLNDAMDASRGGIFLKPRVFTLYNYEYVLREASIFHSLMISVLRTVIGTAVAVFCSAMVAYTVSRPEYLLRKWVALAFILTMYFNGGLIPTYLLHKELHLINSFWVYIIPGIVGAFNIIIIRSFIEGIPDGINESAKIDGAGDFKIFMKIVLPLCTPVLATVALFVAVWQWNSWFDVFLYNSSNPKLSTLQYELMKILQTANGSSTQATIGDVLGGNQRGVAANQVTPTSIRATMTIVASLPIILVYPFLQKYFVKGMTLGGVKG